MMKRFRRPLGLAFVSATALALGACHANGPADTSNVSANAGMAASDNASAADNATTADNASADAMGNGGSIVNASVDTSKYLDQPIITSLYTADPSAHVFNGKVYIYPSHDIPSHRAPTSASTPMAPDRR